MATREEIAAWGDALVRAQAAAGEARKAWLTRREAAVRGLPMPDDADYWGALRVNAQALRRELERLLLATGP